MTDKVQDIITENGIKTNNLISSLILAGILALVGMVFSINQNVSEMVTAVKVLGVKVEHNEMAIKHHVDNKSVHVK